MTRVATIDIGTNSVLMLVAEERSSGRFEPLCERSEITRLGRGVDERRLLSPDGIADTVAVLEQMVEQARRLGATQLAAVATSAARDAGNRADLLHQAQARAGVTIEVLSGVEEARLMFEAAASEFGRPDQRLVAVDIGGGSTELAAGTGALLESRQSFDVGSVRLTERFIHADPPTAAERRAVEDHLEEQLAAVPREPLGTRLVGIAGTVVTLYTVLHALEPFDPSAAQGKELSLSEVDQTAERLWSLSLAQRRALPGLPPKRADVLPVGALLLRAVMARLGLFDCTVSDRGLRWGLLHARFGRRHSS